MKANMERKIAVNNIVAMVKKHGSQAKFADYIGLPLATFWRYYDKLTRGEAIPERLVETICNKFNLQREQLFSTSLDRNLNIYDSFAEKYYAYFLTAYDPKSIKIDVADVKMCSENVGFSIRLSNVPPKVYSGRLYLEPTCLNVHLFSCSDKSISNQVFIMMPWTTVPPQKYYGGMGLMLIMTDRMRNPCVLRIMLSSEEFNINRKKDDFSEADYEYLQSQLRLDEDCCFAKASVSEDIDVVKHIIHKATSKK